MNALAPFPCNGCGRCCQLIDRSPATSAMDRGDGTCRHFDDATRGCTIYATRPLVCRVQDYYTLHLVDQIAWKDFVMINVAVCTQLQSA